MTNKELAAFLKNGGKVGVWTFRSEHMLLQKDDVWVVVLDKIKTRADVISVLFDASNRNFLTNEDVGMLVRALDRVFDFSTLPYAKQPINIRQTISKRIEVLENETQDR